MYAPHFGLFDAVLSKRHETVAGSNALPAHSAESREASDIAHEQGGQDDKFDNEMKRMRDEDEAQKLHEEGVNAINKLNGDDAQDDAGPAAKTEP